MSNKSLLALLLSGFMAISAPAASRAEQDGKDALSSAAVSAPNPAPEGASAKNQLTPEEEQALQARNEEPGPKVRGGALTTQQLTYIVIALAAIVLVLVLK